MHLSLPACRNLAVSETGVELKMSPTPVSGERLSTLSADTEAPCVPPSNAIFIPYPVDFSQQSPRLCRRAYSIRSNHPRSCASIVDIQANNKSFQRIRPLELIGYSPDLQCCWSRRPKRIRPTTRPFMIQGSCSANSIDEVNSRTINYVWLPSNAKRS